MKSNLPDWCDLWFGSENVINDQKWVKRNSGQWLNQDLNYMDPQFQFSEPFVFTKIKGGVRQPPPWSLREKNLICFEW